MLIEIAVVSPQFLSTSVVPITALMLLAMAPSLLLWYRVRRQPSQMPEQTNPTHMKSALVFAGVYAVVLIALAAAREYAGNEALYIVSAISGLTDMDAITLSTAALANRDPEILEHGWKLILAAALASLVFKAALVGILGGRLFLEVAAFFSIPILGGLLLILVLPSITGWP